MLIGGDISSHLFLLGKRTDVSHDAENEDGGPQDSAVVRLGQREMWGGHRERGRLRAAVRGPWLRAGGCWEAAGDCSVGHPQADSQGAPAAPSTLPLLLLLFLLFFLLLFRTGLQLLFAILSIFR